MLLSIVSSASLTVVIVHWNQPSSCCAVSRRMLDDAVECRVVVVDNASAPANLEALRADLPAEVEVLESPSNLGFGPGANVGLRHWLAEHETPLVAVVPHDAQPAPDTLSLLVRTPWISPRHWRRRWQWFHPLLR